MNRLTVVLMAIVLGAIFVGSGLTQSVSAQGASRAVSAGLSGAAEVPAVDTTASGLFSGAFSGGELTFNLTSDAVGITQAHIHMGAVDANGAPVVFLFGAVDPGVDGINVDGTITEADLIGAVEGDFQAFAQALLAGNAYVNVHTETNPGGEVRGQISAGEARTGVPVTMVSSTAVPMAAGGNLMGWTGLDTTSKAILDGNADLMTVWVFGGEAWDFDSTRLPRPSLAVTAGTGLFIVASTATDLMVPTSLRSTAPFVVFRDELDFANVAANFGTELGFDATLTRSQAGMSLSASVSGLTPGGTYTLWLILFNDPTACAAACAGSDLMGAGVGGSGVNGDGLIADANGNGTYAATLAVGDAGHHQVIFGPGLTDPMDAELHVVIRNHGPTSADPAELLEQTSIVQGGCTEESSVTGTGTGTFTCWDPYVGIFSGSNTTVSSLEIFQSEAEVAAPNIGEEINGTSTVVRTVNGLDVTIVDNELTAGNVYTIWILIDQPGVANPDAEGPGSVFDIALNLTFGVADENGVGTFSGTLAANVEVVADDGTGKLIIVPGTLVDPIGANVRLFVKDHGPPLEDETDFANQTLRFDGVECPCVDPHQSFHNP